MSCANVVVRVSHSQAENWRNEIRLRSGGTPSSNAEEGPRELGPVRRNTVTQKGTRQGHVRVLSLAGPYCGPTDAGSLMVGVVIDTKPRVIELVLNPPLLAYGRLRNESATEYQVSDQSQHGTASIDEVNRPRGVNERRCRRPCPGR